MVTTYKTKLIEVKGNTWSVLFAEGEFNYISIRKETNNPFKTIGKEFKNFDDAQKHYKCSEMKLALLKLELELN